MRVGVFHPGTNHSWQTALAFQENQTLAWYATSVFYDPKRWPYRIESYLPARYRYQLHREFTRRYTPLLDPKLIRRIRSWEWLRVASSRLSAHKFNLWLYQVGNARFGAPVIQLIEREPVDVVWGYNTSALEVFRWAKKRGIKCVLDQMIGHPIAENSVMQREQAEHPEFFMTDYKPFSQEWIDRQNEEIALADCIVAGSPFCARTLIENGCPKDKIVIVPYGYDDSLMPETMPERSDHRSHPLKFLFVGAIHPRKGVQYLLPAFARLPRDAASLTLVGGLYIPEKTFKKFSDRVLHIPHVPRNEVARYYSESDCFIFPSLFEGSAMVLCEALGFGLGIVQSESSGMGVVGEKNGIILPSVSEDAVLQAMKLVINNPDRLVDWQQASWNMRGERTWSQYREKIRQLLTHH
jgi:glycosyltransferase involved in cell wall biosynthesis